MEYFYYIIIAIITINILFFMVRISNLGRGHPINAQTQEVIYTVVKLLILVNTSIRTNLLSESL